MSYNLKVESRDVLHIYKAYKAKSVTKGYAQEKGIYFDKTFLPMVKTNTLRIVLALMATEYMELVQMDGKIASIQ